MNRLPLKSLPALCFMLLGWLCLSGFVELPAPHQKSLQLVLNLPLAWTHLVQFGSLRQDINLPSAPKTPEAIATGNREFEAIPTDERIREIWRSKLESSPSDHAEKLDFSAVAELNEKASTLWSLFMKDAGGSFDQARILYMKGKHREQVREFRKTVNQFFASTWIQYMNEPTEEEKAKTLKDSFSWIGFKTPDEGNETTHLTLPYVHPMVTEVVLEDVTEAIHYKWEKSVSSYYFFSDSSYLKNIGQMGGKSSSDLAGAKWQLAKELLFLSYFSFDACSQFGLWRITSRTIFPRKDEALDPDFYPGIPWNGLLVWLGVKVKETCRLNDADQILYEDSIHKQIINSYREIRKRSI